MVHIRESPPPPGALAFDRSRGLFLVEGLRREGGEGFGGEGIVDFLIPSKIAVTFKEK